MVVLTRSAAVGPLTPLMVSGLPGTLEWPRLPLTCGDCPTLGAQGLLSPIAPSYHTHRPTWERPHLPVVLAPCWDMAGTPGPALGRARVTPGVQLVGSPPPLMPSVGCWAALLPPNHEHQLPQDTAPAHHSPRHKVLPSLKCSSLGVCESLSVCSPCVPIFGMFGCMFLPAALAVASSWMPVVPSVLGKAWGRVWLCHVRL